MAEETTDFDQAMGQVESALGELERRQNEAPVRKGPFAKRIYGIPLAILALIMSAAVVAAVVIVTQTFPAVPATGRCDRGRICTARIFVPEKICECPGGRHPSPRA